jgi:hypothetical protein
LPRAEKYTLNATQSGNTQTYVDSHAVFEYQAPFAYDPSRIVDATAPYGTNHIAEVGKILSLRYSGGIADLKPTTQDFQLYFGTKIDGRVEIIPMVWYPSPTRTYVAYTLDWIVPQTASEQIEFWYEGRYTENGVEKRAYDSVNGFNYRLKLVQSAQKSLCFDAGWREGLRGGLVHEGESIEIVYDVGRLVSRMMGPTYAAWPAWSAYMHYQILNPGDQVLETGRLPVFAHAVNPSNGSPTTRRPSYKPLIHIPEAAEGGKLMMWFEGPNRGPTEWDSDYTRNYTINIH